VTTEQEEREHWHLDKRVPISLIVTIMVQTAAFMWFLSSLSHRVEANTDAITELAQSAQIQDERVRNNTNGITRMTEALRSSAATLESIDGRLARIERALDRQP